MIYLAQRQDTGAVVEFEEDPEHAPGYSEPFLLPLDGLQVPCKRVITAPQVLATDRRKRFDEAYRPVRSDGRLSSMQLPTRQQAEAQGLPAAPYYNGNDEASFMTRDQAKDYAKALTDADAHQVHEFDA